MKNWCTESIDGVRLIKEDIPHLCYLSIYFSDKISRFRSETCLFAENFH